MTRTLLKGFSVLRIYHICQRPSLNIICYNIINIIRKFKSYYIFFMMPSYIVPLMYNIYNSIQCLSIDIKKIRNRSYSESTPDLEKVYISIRELRYYTLLIWCGRLYAHNDMPAYLLLIAANIDCEYVLNITCICIPLEFIYIIKTIIQIVTHHMCVETQ